MPALMKAGWFLCNVKEWGIREAKESPAVSVTLKLETCGEWDGKQWVEFPMCDTFGDFYIIKKDNQPNVTALKQLADAGIWRDEGLMGFEQPPPDGFQVAVQVEANVYQGKTTYKAAWIYAPDHTPGSGGIANRATAERLLAIEQRAGALLRAAVPPKKEVPF